MGNKISLLDMNFKSLSVEEKRAALVLLDTMMKKLHERNLMVVDFRPNQIYFQDGIFSFENVVPIGTYYSDNKDNAILRNVLGLSNLAFCSYLPDYRLELGLLSYEVIHDNFNIFVSYFPEEDREYYKDVFIDSYNNKKISGDTVYYSDYVIKQNKNSNNSSKNSFAYIKTTEAGRAFAKQDEQGFGHNFFLLTIVASLIVMLIGLVLYLASYLG